MAKVIIYRQIQQEYHDITLLQGNILQTRHILTSFSRPIHQIQILFGTGKCSVQPTEKIRIKHILR